MSEVIFIFSPFLPASASSPYLAPHLLTTILRKEGFKVTNLDYNRAMVDRLDHPPFIQELEPLVTSMLQKRQDIDPATIPSLEAVAGIIENFKKNLQNGIRNSFQNKVNFGNFIANAFLNNLKSVKDYSERGFDIAAPLRNLFYQMIDELELDGKTVCVSCAFGNQLPFSLEIGRYIRSKKKNTKIILGGAQISLLPCELVDQIRDMKIFNVLFTGYAEDRISEVVKNCPDTFFESPTTGNAATSKMLDALPYTEFDEIEKYAGLNLPIMVNKGCYWGKCSFCDYILMGDLGGFRYISRSVHIVLDEIKQLRAKFPDSNISLISDAVPPKFYRELCEAANAEGFELRTTSYMINNKNITEDFFREAAKARIGTIVFGTESTSDRVLELMQKQGRRQDILQNLEHARKYGLSVKVNLIPNYPTTTFAEAMQTYLDISNYEDFLVRLAVFKFYLSANTKMDQSPEDYALEINDEIPYLKSLHNGFHSREFTKRLGMTPKEEEVAYQRFYSMANRISLNARRRYFMREINTSNLTSLYLSNSYKIRRENDSTFLFSYDLGSEFRLEKGDAELIEKLIDNRLTIAQLKEELGEKALDWFSHHYSLGVFEIAA